MRTIVIAILILISREGSEGSEVRDASRSSSPPSLPSQTSRETGLASWYGEEHRGRRMANGQRFNPDLLIAASWDYPLGTRVRVSRADGIPLTVVVTITDRGPHRRFVRQGRVIDLSRAAFAGLEGLEMGLVAVTISPGGLNAGRSGLDGERRRDARVSPGGLERHTPNPADHSAPAPACLFTDLPHLYPLPKERTLALDGVAGGFDFIRVHPCASVVKK